MPVSDTSQKHLAEYSWEQEFEGRRFPVKVRVFFTPLATEKYHISVLISGDWWPSGGRGYQPSESELRAVVSSQMPAWKNIGVI
jgi:hypothetical protein